MPERDTNSIKGRIPCPQFSRHHKDTMAVPSAPITIRARRICAAARVELTASEIRPFGPTDGIMPVGSVERGILNLELLK